MNILAITKLIMPHPGNVKIQVSIISFTTLKLMADSRFTAPTPMMALVFVWVVDTGMPNTLERSRQKAPARVGRKALVALQLHHVHAHGLDDLLSSHARPKPHDDTAQEHEPHRISMPLTEFWPLQKAMPRNSTPINFWPS